MLKNKATNDELLKLDFKFVGSSYHMNLGFNNSIDIAKDDLWLVIDDNLEKIQHNIVVVTIKGETKYATKNDLKILCEELIAFVDEVIETIDVPTDAKPICFEILNDISTRSMGAKERELNVRYLKGQGFSQMCIDDQLSKMVKQNA